MQLRLKNQKNRFMEFFFKKLYFERGESNFKTFNISLMAGVLATFAIKIIFTKFSISLVKN